MLDYFGNQLDPSQFYFRTYKYFGDFTLNALQVLPGQNIALKGQEMYFAIMRMMSVSTGSFRITSPSKKRTTSVPGFSPSCT